MLSVIDRWFEPVSASQDYTRNHYILLALLIAAGAVLRLWCLDNVGLHGDEDIMGLAARGILEHGVPDLPSGMAYWRAPAHTYVLAGSILLFGDTEWALRFPSALVGSLCGLLAFAAGRRILDPIPNLAFVATVMFLPSMIEISQTARMYVFLVAGVLAFCILLFRWERTQSTGDFALAVLLLLVTIQFHRLAVFAAPMLLYPGIARRSPRQLAFAAVGIAGSGIFSEWAGSVANKEFPTEDERMPEEEFEQSLDPGVAQAALGLEDIFPAVAASAAVALILLLRAPTDRRRILPVALLLAGSAACTFRQYHVGVILLIAGGLIWLRCGGGWRRLLAILIVLSINAAWQFYELSSSGAFPGRKIIGAFVGTPSVWPTLRFAEFSYVGVGILVVGIAHAVFTLSRGGKVPSYFLFLLIAVWLPLFAIGSFRWSVPLRYVIGPLPFFLLVVVATANYLATAAGQHSAAMRLSERALAGAMALVVVLIVNPLEAWAIARNSYDLHPDHKGAAEFVRERADVSNDIVIAEDSIVHTYYLGRVNYRLQSYEGARTHARFDGKTLYDQYSGAPVLGSGAELRAILDASPSANVFVIGSAQVSKGLSARNRGNGIAEVLNSSAFEVRYLGRDRETTVWIRESARTRQDLGR